MRARNTVKLTVTTIVYAPKWFKFYWSLFLQIRQSQNKCAYLCAYSLSSYIKVLRLSFFLNYLKNNDNAVKVILVTGSRIRY